MHNRIILFWIQKEMILNEPVGYTPDKEEYEAWLKSGISKHKKGGL
jgi:hypothetical protein